MKKLLLLWPLLFSLQAFGQVWTYDCPGGEEFQSPDYEVSIIQSDDTLNSFVYYSDRKDSYIRYNWNLQPDDTTIVSPVGHRRHSSSIFSFKDSVIVRVKIKSGASNLTLPLKSAKILPSSYNIPCVVKDGNIIEFKLDRPEKVIVFPNYEEAWEIYAQKGIGHIPIQSWKNSYGLEKTKESYHGTDLDSHLEEGYQNPLFIFAHPPEKRVPDSGSVNTLVVNPGDNVSQALLNQYDTVWFKPGIHDLSHEGEIPWFQTHIKKGQAFYFEGGSYVKARFKESNIGYGYSSIIGRGIISGIGHKWVRSFEEGSQLINIDSIIGVTITDRACFGIYGGRYIGDIAMIGAWHGNTDGPDYVDNCLIENCFLMALDDNLKINHNTHARHCIIWQGPNAHAIMVKETFRDGMTFANSVVEDIDIVAYLPDTDWDHPWPHISRGAISVVTAMDLKIRNLTFDNIRIESPYLSRVLGVYNLNTNQINPGWFNNTSESYHTNIDGITFSNISVNSPVIAYTSLIGSGYKNALKNIHFSNMNINGTEVTLENKDEFFEIECEMIENLTFNEKEVICDPKRSSFQGSSFQFPGDSIMAWQYDYFQNNAGDTLFAMDSSVTIGVYGCNNTSGLNIRSYDDEWEFVDAAQFKWDASAQTFSKNGQWVEYSVLFTDQLPYQLLLRTRNPVDAKFKLIAYTSSGDTALYKEISVKDDFTNLDGGNEQTDWLLSKFVITELWGPYILRFDWYDNVGEPGIFGAFSFTESKLDISPPGWYFVTVGTLSAGTDIVVLTTEDASVYLVPNGTEPTSTSIMEAAVGMAEVSAYIQSTIATSGLTAGNYVAYAIDNANNISEASRLITIEETVNTPVNSVNNQISVTYDPAYNFITIHSRSGIGEIRMYDVLGKELMRSGFDGKTYDFQTNGFTPGVYILHVHDTNGNIIRNKILIE